MAKKVLVISTSHRAKSNSDKLGRCAIQDDANDITEEILTSDVVVWATPIYYYEMAGQIEGHKALREAFEMGKNIR